MLVMGIRIFFCFTIKYRIAMPNIENVMDFYIGFFAYQKFLK